MYRAVYMVWQITPGWTVAGGVLVVMQGALPLVSLYLIKLMVDTVVTAQTGLISETALEQATVVVVGLAGVSFAGSLCNSLSALVSEAQKQVVTDHVQQIIQAKSVDLDLDHFENAEYHETLHRAQQEAPYRPALAVNGLILVARSGLTLAIMVGLLASWHWSMALALLAAALPSVFVRGAYARRLYIWQRRHTSQERLAWYMHMLLTVEAAAKEIRLFGLESLFIEWFGDLRRGLRQGHQRIATQRAALETAANAGSSLVVFGFYFYIVRQALHGDISLGTMIVYQQAFQRGQGYLAEFLGGLASLYENNLFLVNLFEFLDLPSHAKPSRKSRQLSDTLSQGFVIDHVSYRHPNSNRKAVDDVSLKIRPGECIALVGDNGSGKTTLIKLLCGLYDPCEGQITLEDTDLRQFETTALRSHISVVFQDYIRYHLTLRENIWLGDRTLSPSNEGILDAVSASGTDTIVTKLPHGYDTVLSNWLDEGTDLSLGEWQRVALARAFFRAAPIFILDEPASALDAQTEHELLERFYQLAAGRISILSSHRLSAVRRADRIYLLEDGRIVEQGGHEELVQLGGKYARMFQLQSEGYQ